MKFEHDIFFLSYGGKRRDVFFSELGPKQGILDKHKVIL
jgi:hypothetical protein